MQMLSTRGAAAVSPSMAILRGLAPDGGLYVPAEFPSFTAEEIRSLAKMDYQERAAFVLGRFLPDFTQDELRGGRVPLLPGESTDYTVAARLQGEDGSTYDAVFCFRYDRLAGGT